MANSSGTCTGLDWSDAATLRDGTISVTGDGDLNTPDETLDAAGCYGYTATLTGADYGGNPITSEASTPGEVVQVKAPPPPPPPPPGPPNPAPGAGSACAVQTPSSRVTIVKHVDDAKVTLGKPLTYTLTVSNRGPDTATGVTVTDTPSAKMKILSVRTASGICTSELPLTCHLKPIDDGGRATITVRAVPLTAGAVVNHAHVTSQDHNTAPRRDVFAAASTRVMVPLKLTKTASARTVDAGATVSYRVAVANPTNVTARSAQVCDKLPAGLALVSASVRTRLHHGSLCWTIASVAPRPSHLLDDRAGPAGRQRQPGQHRDGIRARGRRPARPGERPDPPGGCAGPAGHRLSGRRGHRLGQAGDHEQLLVAQLAPGDPQHPVPGRDHQLVAPAVALERGSMAVVPVPVDLQHQLVLRPQKVGEVAEQALVEQRAREARRAGQLDHRPLGPRAGVAGLRLGPQQRANHRRALQRRRSLDHRVQLAVGDEPLNARFGECGLGLAECSPFPRGRRSSARATSVAGRA